MKGEKLNPKLAINDFRAAPLWLKLALGVIAAIAALGLIF